MNDMDPGSDVFVPTRYTLRIYDIKDREGHLIHFQASTPFPNFAKGDFLKTTSWSLRTEGKLVRVAEVQYSLYSIDHQVFCETYVYCSFPEFMKP